MLLAFFHSILRSQLNTFVTAKLGFFCYSFVHCLRFFALKIMWEENEDLEKEKENVETVAGQYLYLLEPKILCIGCHYFCIGMRVLFANLYVKKLGM